MKYKIKMLFPVLMIVVCMFATTICITVVDSLPFSLFMIILLGIELHMLFRRPRILFEKRLNSNFVVIKYPCCRWKGIYQMPAKKFLADDCETNYRSLCVAMKDLFSHIESEHGYFRTITHGTVKRRLQKSAADGKLKILVCEPSYKKALKRIFVQAVNKKCSRCEKSGTCPHCLAAKKIRQFYYMEFYIPEHKRPEALPVIFD